METDFYVLAELLKDYLGLVHAVKVRLENVTISFNSHCCVMTGTTEQCISITTDPYSLFPLRPGFLQVPTRSGPGSQKSTHVRGKLVHISGI